MDQATAAEPTQNMITLPIAQLELSNTRSQAERRAHLDKGAIAELADSLRTVGMLQPLVVRPTARAYGATHEIVAGERRYLAAKQAGLESVPVNVRQLTDDQVIEVQLIENLQREGLHELAEAEGYEALMKLGHSVDELVDKVGKSKAYVYARLKLTALCKAARDAFYDEKLNSSTALLLARIPQEQLQKQALGEITKPRWGDEVMSVRAASEHIHNNYMLRLDQAGFPTGDADLVPAAGPCGTCPKRTGNQRELFNDVKGADVCTDPICFRAKRDAQAVRLKAAAEAKGQTVISGKDAKKIAPNGAERSSLHGYVRLDDKCYSDSKMRKYRQLLGKGFEASLLQDPDTGAIIEVATEAAVNKVLPASKRSGGDSYQAKQRAADKKRKVELEYRAELARQVYAAGFKDDAEADLLLACEAMFDRLHHDARKRLFKVMGWESVKKKRSYGGAIDTYEIEPHLKVPQGIRPLEDAAHPVGRWRSRGLEQPGRQAERSLA